MRTRRVAVTAADAIAAFLMTRYRPYYSPQTSTPLMGERPPRRSGRPASSSTTRASGRRVRLPRRRSDSPWVVRPGGRSAVALPRPFDVATEAFGARPYRPPPGRVSRGSARSNRARRVGPLSSFRLAAGLVTGTRTGPSDESSRLTSSRWLTRVETGYPEVARDSPGSHRRAAAVTSAFGGEEARGGAHARDVASGSWPGRSLKGLGRGSCFW
jgi:hypothetical protein